MTVAEIRQILESPYDRKVWKGFIQTQFTNNKLNAEDRTILLSDKTLSKQCLSLGNYEINEYTNIGIFEVELNEKVNIARNRVALRNLIKDITKQVAGAMVVFVQGEKWRFSYISKRKVKNAANEIEDKQTAPKRYTYLFGKNEKALTAAIRFDKLIQKQKENIFQFLSLDDFEEAFSVEKLSKEFFKNYKEIYEDFVQFLTGKRYEKKGNKYVEQVIHEPNWQLTSIFSKDEKQARDFCKRIMGRIVFLYFIQKKGWLAVKQGKKWGEGNPDYLYDLFRKSKYKDDFYARELVPLFFTRLNNEDSENKAREERFPYLNGGLFDDSHDRKYNKLFLPEEIFERLFTIFNNYNFTVYEDAPDEHTVAVDPEMLGHIFENLLEDNKDKGAYYTPKEIVHYMCKESLKAYLYTHSELHIDETPIAKSAIGKIIQQQELNADEIQFAEKQAYKIIDALEQVKICDPAIGSGAFPMGLLQEIFNAQIYLQELKGFKKGVTDADIKKHIIEESIYGVDIDAGAVDIARLRFWLSLVVDEQEPQPLPNLDFKIVCANTLIPLGKISEHDMEAKASLAVKELEKIRHNFFNVSSEEKLKLERQFKKVQTDLLNLRELSSKENYGIYTKLYEFNPFDFESLPCSWFDPWWMFGVKGFDIVIGNPPYRVVSKKEQEIYPKYSVLSSGELYAYFFENSIDRLLNSNGIIAFITASLFVKGLKFGVLRDYLEHNLDLITFEIKGDEVFENVQMPTSILIGQKNKGNKWKFSEFSKQGNILDAINNDTIQLTSISKIMRGFEIGRDKVSDEGDVEFITGSDVKKWNVTQVRYISKQTAKEFNKNPLYFEGERILIRETGSNLTVLFVENKLLCNRSLYSIKITDKKYNAKYITALLNSSLMQFYYVNRFRNETDLFPKIRIAQVKLLPIKYIELSYQKYFASIVDYIMYLTNKTSEQIISHTENERIASHCQDIINMITYEIYFTQQVKAVGIDVMKYLGEKLDKIHNKSIQEQIKEFYIWYQKPENTVRQRMQLIDTRSPDIIALINKSLQQ